MLSRYDTKRKRGYRNYHYHLAGTTWRAMSARRVQALHENGIQKPETLAGKATAQHYFCQNIPAQSIA